MTKKEEIIERIGFLRGAIEGIRLYAIWGNGEQLVGVMRRPLKEALLPYREELARLEKESSAPVDYVANSTPQEEGKEECDVMIVESPLKREFDYYLANQDEMVKKYDGRFVVIKNCAVIGVYADQATSVSETAKQHELGTFLVQKVEPGTGAYTQTFHSRFDGGTK